VFKRNEYHENGFDKHRQRITSQEGEIVP
jgi:hypothetical protein